MAERVIRTLTGWSLAQYVAYRQSLQPTPAFRAATARAMAAWPEQVPVGESLLVAEHQLSDAEQRRWGALAADETLTQEERSRAMRGPQLTEREALRRRCAEAILHAAALPDTSWEAWERAQRARLYAAGAAPRARARELEDGQRKKQGLPAKYDGIGYGDPLLQAGEEKRPPAVGRLFTDAELDACIPQRLQFPAHLRRA